MTGIAEPYFPPKSWELGTAVFGDCGSSRVRPGTVS